MGYWHTRMLHVPSTLPNSRANGASALLLTLTIPLILTCLLANTGADADLWGHLTFGRDIVRSHAVHATDPVLVHERSPLGES